MDHGAVGQRPPKGSRGALVQIPGDEAGERREVVSAAGQSLVHSLLHEVLVHAFHDEACSGGGGGSGEWRVVVVVVGCGAFLADSHIVIARRQSLARGRKPETHRATALGRKKKKTSHACVYMKG